MQSGRYYALIFHFSASFSMSFFTTWLLHWEIAYVGTVRPDWCIWLLLIILVQAFRFSFLIKNTYSEERSQRSKWRAQVCLLADVIQHFVDQKLDFDCAYVYEDIQKCIEHVHRSGNLHKSILKDPAKYLQKNVCFWTLQYKIKAIYLILM